MDPNAKVASLRLHIPPGISFADLSVKYHQDTRAVSLDQKPLRRVYAASGIPRAMQETVTLEIMHLILRAWYQAALAGGEPQDTQMEWFIAANEPAHSLN